MTRHSRSRRPAGFSLVEVMVALIVISVGLLGIAKMQAVSLASTNAARIRSLAAIEAASLASAMHANRGYWAFNAPTVNVAGTSMTATSITSTDAGLTTGGNCNVGGGSAPCSTTLLAAADLQEWATEMNGMLPLSTATITCSNLTTPLSCTIQIFWKENVVGSQQAAAANNFQTQSYLLYVQP